VPVTVLTYLGAGKQPTQSHPHPRTWLKGSCDCQRVWGSGIDTLVIDADEEDLRENNGCICCTVRGDLIRIISNLMRRDKFDHLVIETTGLADPNQ